MPCAVVPPLSSPPVRDSLRRSVFAWQPSEMEVLIAAPAKCEVRAVIRFLHARKFPPVEIHRQLIEVYGEECMSIHTSNGAGLLLRVARKFIMKNGVEDRRFRMRLSRRSTVSCSNIGGSLSVNLLNAFLELPTAQLKEPLPQGKGTLRWQTFRERR